jgi:hypothetical protein
MLFKRCFKCFVEMPLTAFYKHSRMKDGHLNKCIECTKKDVSSARLEKIEYYRSYDRRRTSMPHRVALRNRVSSEWRANNPTWAKAQDTLGNAVRDGKVQRHPCWVCGEKAHGHHPDYDRPLEVVWLCPAHHKAAHAAAA